MGTHLKRLEREVTASMRTAIANLDGDLSLVREQLYAAHDLFGDHLMEWSEEFAKLYNQMLEIHRAHTPMPRGHYRTRHIGIGYSSFPVQTWIVDKEQPATPTADELVQRFDQLISAHTGKEETMTEQPGKQEEARTFDPQEIKKGLSVWVQLHKKGARVAATIRDISEDRSSCTVDLEIDDPIHAGQMIRQVYPKPVQIYQLTRRERPSLAEATPAPAQKRLAMPDAINRPAPHAGRTDIGADLREAIPQDQVEAEPKPTPKAVPESHTENQALEPASLTTYSRETLRFQGPHDQARRAYLRAFAQERGYQAFWFTIHGSRSGYYQAGIPAGEEGWTHFLERAMQFDIFCAFIATYAPGKLEQFLTDAAARGEIRLGMDMGLTWTPGKRSTPRER
jgi:hypothetical protein